MKKYITLYYFVLIFSSSLFLLTLFYFSIQYYKKRKLVGDIIKEWKKTGGEVFRDSTTIYEYDYYLTLHKKSDYYNHIHLGLKHFHYNHNNHNNIIYLMKKIKNDKSTNIIIHSKPIHISIFSDPKIIVKHMRNNYNKFKSQNI